MDQSEEEAPAIVVTGSRIVRSEGVAPASPLEVLGSERLERTTSNSIATFLKDLPSNFGATFGSGQGVGSNRGTGTVNLRGLGAQATLVLLDGQRTTQVPDSPDNVVDINTLIPQIMINRIEVVKDGASAIYGSDAVAGVVNFITKSNFSGLELNAQGGVFTYSGKGDLRLEALAGTSLGDRGHLVIAASYIDQQALMLGSDIPVLEGQAYDARWSSPTSWPGIFSVPRRDATGGLTGTRASTADPLCGEIQGAFPSSGRIINGVAERLPSAEGATQCRFHFYPEGSAQAALRQYQVYLTSHYELTPGIRLDLSAGYTKSRNLSYFTSGATSNTPNLVVPGHNPGNTFRAVDADGNPLFAVSSGQSAGYSRDGAEVFLPQRDTSGNVVLTSDPTNAASGIPFYEDVIFTGRGIGSQGGLPTGNTWDQPGYSRSRPSKTENDLIRIVAGFSGNFDANWSWQASGNYSHYTMTTNGTVGMPLQMQLRSALAGLGGPNCQGNTPGQNGCEYYNIAGNSVFATAPGDPQANSQEVIDWIFPLLLERYKSDLMVGEVSVTGNLIDLPAGSLGVAAGYQVRRAGLVVDYDTNQNIRNTASNTISYDIADARTTHAFYAEGIAPIFDSQLGYLEFSGAIRHERSEGYQTTDPKLGLLFNTSDRLLTLRATYGTSFVAPSLFRLFAVAGGGGQVNDVCANPVCTGTLNQVISSQTSGNPDLRPESATTYSAGGVLRPLPGLELSVDWWRYNFRDRIATESPQSVLNMDPDGSLTGRVIRGANGQVTQIITQYFNAAAVITEGIDMAVRFNQDFGSAGNFTANLSASYVPVYKWQLNPGAAFENYAGQDNQGRSGAALGSPKWRGNLFLNWETGNHTLSSTIHYTDGLLFNKDGRLSPTLNPDYEVESWTTVDLSYSYSLGGRAPGPMEDVRFTVGVVNLFATGIPELPVPATQTFNGSLYDIRGRKVWAGVNFSF